MKVTHVACVWRTFVYKLLATVLTERVLVNLPTKKPQKSLNCINIMNSPWDQKAFANVLIYNLCGLSNKCLAYQPFEKLVLKKGDEKFKV